MCDPVPEGEPSSLEEMLNRTTPSSFNVSIPEEEIERMNRLRDLEAQAIISAYMATPELRWVIHKDRTNLGFPTLQQLWKAQRAGGGFALSWRDVPLVEVEPGKEHE